MSEKPYAIGSKLLPILLFAVGLSCIEKREIPRPPEETIVARINDHDLTKKEFELFLPEEYQGFLTTDEKEEYLDRWITTELLYQEALKQGLGSSEDIKIRTDQYKRELIADRLVQSVIEQRAVVSDEEVRRYYEEHEKEYTKEFRVSHILVNSREEADKIKDLLKRHSFAWVARRYSIDKHTRRGGDLGFLSKGNMIPEFERVVFNMKVGEVSDIIESEFGYHIIKLTDIRDARFKMGLEDVGEEIANKLMMIKREEVYDSLVQALKSRARVQVFDRIMAETYGDTLE